MSYATGVFMLLVMAATLTASWALNTDIERRIRVFVKPRLALHRRAARLVGAGLLGATIVMGGAIAVAHWRAQRSVDAGLQLLAEGDAAAAVRTLTAVLAGRRDDPRVHYHLGEAYTRLGVFDAAVTHLKKAVDRVPNDATFHRGLGEAYRRAGDTSLARRELETAVRLEPAAPEHRITLAGALLDNGDVAGAVEQLRMAARAQPRSAEIRLLLAMTLGLTGDERRMIRELREVRRLAPGGALSEIALQEARRDITDGDRRLQRPERPSPTSEQKAGGTP